MVTADKHNPNKFTVSFNCIYVVVVEASNPFEAAHKYFKEFDEFAAKYNTEEKYIKLSPPQQSLEVYSHNKDGSLDA